MSRRAPARGVRPTPATHCPGGECATGPSLPPFGYVQPATLSSVFPRGGPTAGGTAIILRGHGFRGFDPGSLCEFGALPAPATAWAEGGGRLRDDAWAEGLNTVALNCTAPPMPMAEHTSVHARLSPSLRAAFSVRFRYYDEPQVRGLEPSGGTARGGTLVEVRGAGFGPYVELRSLTLCRFGSQSADVAVDSVSRAAAAASNAVVVAADGQQTAASHVGSLASGGINGGGIDGPNGSTPLRTHAPHLVAVVATVVSDSVLHCLSPASETFGGLHVEVSLNGIDFSTSSTPMLFEYYDNWIVPRLGGAPPSPRVLHAAALVGSRWWFFGGLASVFRPGAGWATRRASVPHDALAEGAHEPTSTLALPLALSLSLTLTLSPTLDLTLALGRTLTLALIQTLTLNPDPNFNTNPNPNPNLNPDPTRGARATQRRLPTTTALGERARRRTHARGGGPALV